MRLIYYVEHEIEMMKEIASWADSTILSCLVRGGEGVKISMNVSITRNFDCMLTIDLRTHRVHVAFIYS
jgi:hypothetical protein